MLRMLAVGLVGLLAALPATAGNFTDDTNRFKLSAPDGWVTEPSPDPIVAIILASPRKADTRGNCNVAVSANQMVGKTQAEVDNELSGMVNEQFWRVLLGQVKFFKKTTIDKTGDKDQGGRKVFFVQSTSDVEVPGSAFTVTQLVNLHVLPGQTFFVTCSALAASFATESPDFDTILASFEPRPDMTVAATRWSINREYLREATARSGAEAAAAGAKRAARR